MHELVLRVAQEQVEQVSDLLAESLEALSVSVEDADAGTEAEQVIFGEPGLPAPPMAWQRSTLRALFADEMLADQAAAWLLAELGAQGIHLQSLSPLADEDWVRITQSQFAPVAITPSFWIVPSWHDAPPAAREVIRLDPGLAFGTGTHPTTRMCLRWIALNASPWPRVMDYGCGSGILAIAAAKFGAKSIDAVDIDPAALTATSANAQVNRAVLRCGPPELAQGTYALVLANILATPLKLLAPLLARHVAPAGHLVLAGILERQADEMREAYAPHLKIEIGDREEGWVLMTGVAQR